MQERYVYKGTETLIHGQTYHVKNFSPLHYSLPFDNIFIIPPIVNDPSNMGDCLTISNHRVFMERYSHLEGIFNLNCNGSVGVAIRLYLALTNKDINTDIKQTRYAIDNNDLKLEQEKWEQKEVSRIINEISPLINLETYIPNFKDTLLNHDKKDLSWIIKNAVNELGYEWSYNEDPAEQISGENLLPYIEDIFLLDYCKELPLLMNREWSCPYTEDLYHNKFIIVS